MKSRIEAARFAEKLMKDGPTVAKKAAWHFGKCELKELFDFIYEGKPKNYREEIK